MPRPKKAGAPEPKRRSRTGCWPCKTRKVKCDEARPICVNCQRQGETCDYSIRLNWEGRGKKKADSPTFGGFGQMEFSSEMKNMGPSMRQSIPVQESSSYAEFQALSSHLPPIEADGRTISGLPKIQTSPDRARRAELDGQGRLSEIMIDPALMEPNSPTSMYQPSFVQARPDYQHTQSYERYRSRDTPGTPLSVQPPIVSRLRQNFEDGVLSPIDSGVHSPSGSTFLSRGVTLPHIDSPTSTPPFYGNGKYDVDAPGMEPLQYDRPIKRARYQSSQAASPSYDPSMPPPNLASVGTHTVEYKNAPSSTNSANTPLTPASSHSDDGYKVYGSKLSPLAPHDSPDLRRLSVSSLLSGPPGIPYQSAPSSNAELQNWSEEYQDVYQDTTTWGIDRGIKDLDIGKNDDMNAISGTSPIASRDHLELALDEDGGFVPVEFGFGTETHDTAFENRGYYDKPVAICIPRALEPLPNKLLENPMNLLHHFLNHTAGCLIPHNCSSNPFKSILPRMAVQDDDLLNLLLAYSASHRARLLRQPEPATRIALWVQDIFPNLRRALDDPSEIISNANLATAIMLASLEIISPKAFGVAVPWQRHLDTARQIIAARGGPQGMRTAAREDKVSSFLWSWFAYLDVLGSLSGVTTASSVSAWALDYEVNDDKDYQIDCILGFTSKCVRILARIAGLARICDNQRIGPDHIIQPDWKPSEDTVARAEKLEAELSESRMHPARPCTHMQSTGEAAYQWDSLEMAATNEAFHWAGLVHLHRRILGKPSTHPDVQHAVREIHGALFKVRRGSSATACLLFPIFTAGCDTQDEKQRADILERIKGVERFGMTQVHKARTLMERAWETGKPWETLVAGEFFG
ncbi:Thiamine biosynthesis regulatory protein [Lachnellula suecica]|uniref:Thiamine biosynthesis regulatory protein n=1 Tax=Lachnellula suecica TaxID=602035 RepID=A0A8T9CE10_9HELO|nr:Thiamine biosynthesis regulatory protein [Lachnellula suecica]